LRPTYIISTQKQFCKRHFDFDIDRHEG